MSAKVTNGVLPKVRTFCTGTYDAGTPDETICTRADLEDVVRNFRALSAGQNPLHRPPLAKGHEIRNGEAGPDVTRRTDQPACGWVTDCWAEGDYLYTRWEGIPDDVAAEINDGKYRYPSAEFYQDPSEGNLPGSGWCLRRVVMLGATPPRNKQLGQLVPLSFADLRYARVKRYKGSSGRTAYIMCFAEGAPMDRKQLEDQLRSIGMGDAAIQALSDAIADDAAFQNVVMALMAEKAGGGDKAASPPAGNNNADAPAMPPPEQMVADLLAAGVSQAEIDAVKGDPAALYQLWMQKVQSTNMSEPNRQGGGTQAPPAPQPKQIIHKFAEPPQVAALRRQVEDLTRQTGLLFSERERERKATRERTVKELCKKWVDGAYILPGDADPKSTVMNVYHDLMMADGGKVLQFGEKAKTEFDLKVEAIEARGPGYVNKFFSEKIADPARSKATHERAKEAIRARYGITDKKAPSLEERLGMVKPAGMR